MGRNIKKLMIGFIIVLLYCFPFVFYSMYLDLAQGSMAGYLIMLVVTSILAAVSGILGNGVHIIIGNGCSLLVSFYFIGMLDNNYGYFKPLSPGQLMVLNSLLILIPQLIIMKLANVFYIKIKG